MEKTMEKNLKKIMTRLAGVCLLLICVLLVPQRALAIGQVSLKQISRPGEVDALLAADEGMLFYDVSGESYFSFTIPERGWIFLDSTYYIDLYANASITNKLNPNNSDTKSGLVNQTFYLNKGTYYINVHWDGITSYGYFLPSSSVLKVNSSLSSDHTSATFHCTSTVGESAVYSWKNDVSTPDNIQDDQFYSQKNILGEFPVTENGTYSVRVNSSAQEWAKYPVDIQVTVSGIVKACSHEYGDFAVTKNPSVFEEGMQTRICKLCGVQDTEPIPKLNPSMNITVTSLEMKKGQSTTKVKVSGLAEGDYVKSWQSSNPKVVTVDGSGKITAQGAGSAEVTVTLASGLYRTVSVTVQNPKVATKKISGIPKKLTIKKGKTKTLKPKIQPANSTDKVTYKSSNTKIVTVSKKGVIKAKKTGKAKITVQSGKKKVTVTVTVKK